MPAAVWRDAKANPVANWSSEVSAASYAFLRRAAASACDEPGPRAWFYSSVAVAREVAHSFTTKWPSKCLTFVPCTFWENLAGDQCPKLYQGPECHHDLVVFRPKPPRNLGYEWRALYHYPEQPGPLPFLGWVYTDAFGRVFDFERHLAEPLCYSPRSMRWPGALR